MTQRDGVELAVRLAHLEAGDLAGLVFVDDEVVGELECGLDDFRNAVADFARNVHAGFHSGCRRRRQQFRRLGAELCIFRIQRIQQEQVAEMKMFGAVPGKIQVVASPECVGAARVEERAPPALLLGHHVGGCGRCLRCSAEVFGVNLVPLALGENGRARSVFANESGGEEREAHAALCKVEQDIAGRAAGAGVVRVDIGEVPGWRQGVDQLHLVNAPVSAGQQAAPR